MPIQQLVLHPAHSQGSGIPIGREQSLYQFTHQHAGFQQELGCRWNARVCKLPKNPSGESIPYMEKIVRKYITLRKFVYFIFSSFVYIGTVSVVSAETRAPSSAEAVKWLCDFKGTDPKFYTIINGKPQKIHDIGIEQLTPVYNKFVGLKLMPIEFEAFVFGYFLSIHDSSKKIAPNPIGNSYVKKSDLICVDTDNLP